MILVGTSGLLPALDESQRYHHECASLLREASPRSTQTAGIRRCQSPHITPSMRSALEDLRLDRLDVIHAGAHSFPLAKNVRAVAIADLLDQVEPLG